jgi:hypothetical protein
MNMKQNNICSSWACGRCGDAFTGTPPEHGLCAPCIADLDIPLDYQPLAALTVGAVPGACPTCGGPVCADCGKALVAFSPAWPAREVTSDDG